MVEEYWHRSQQASVEAEKEAFKSALRERLGLLEESEEEQAPPPKQEKKPAAKRPNILRMFFINLFKQRIEEGNNVTYRKHWDVLLKQIGIPTIILTALIGLTGMRLYNLALDPTEALIEYVENVRVLDTFAVGLPLLMLPVLHPTCLKKTVLQKMTFCWP